MAQSNNVRRVVIMGAAGRDFHDYNMLFRDDTGSVVVAFTAAQIPQIAGRRYPPSLAGARYPEGIPIVEESELVDLIAREHVDTVLFAYSDAPHEEVMHKASVVLAAGADFVLPGPGRTMLKAGVPVIALSAVRTGCGKSQTARWLSRQLRTYGLSSAVIRHPMPYGDLERQAVQRFACAADLDAASCTVEEREEYEPHLACGTTVFAGIDYARILAQAEQEADVILWDGGNNDFPFIAPDLHIVLVDPLRPGDETTHHPGETVLRMADIVLAAKSNTASAVDVRRVLDAARAVNPAAAQVLGASPVTLDDPEAVRGRRVLIVEDGPTLTHGGMSYGAGYVAAVAAEAGDIVDPRASACGPIRALYDQYPHLATVLPAVGYHRTQLEALAETINASDAEVVVSATPCDLAALIAIAKPVVRVRYEFAEVGEPGLGGLVAGFLAARGLIPPGATTS